MRTYEDVAAGLSLVLCSSCDLADHRIGHANNNTVHWEPRRLERRGLRRFLKLAARLRLHRYDEASPAMKIYMENVWANQAGAALRIRFPYQLTADDRLQVLWLASRGDPITPAAQRWAKRRGPHGLPNS